MSNLDDTLNELNLRLEKYSLVLKAAEEENNGSKVRRYKRIIKQYETAIKDVRAGRDGNLGELPNPPGMPPLTSSAPSTSNQPDDESTENVDYGAEVGLTLPTISEPSAVPTLVAETTEDPTDLCQELELRLSKYNNVLSRAEEEGDSSKIRRYKRIIAQYKSTISRVKNGHEVDLSELPNPPGLTPLVPQKSPMPSPMPSPLPTRARTPTMEPVEPGPSPTTVVTRADKQNTILRTRQKEYRDAAITAKRAGQLTEAKEYLKICKGFDRLIQASESGLPVDLSTIPASPKSFEEAESFHVVSDKDFTENSDFDVFEMLKKELTEQAKSCITRRNQFKATGDVANANRFENFALSFKKDLNNVALFQNSGQPVPKFHFEQKTFSIVQCFSDVAAGNLELCIVQAVNLAKQVDSYVGYEFPFPSDSPPSGYTSVVRNSSNPEYNTVLNFSIDRDSKPCQRIFKRHGIKFEIWSKGGLFHRDSSLGTVVVKLLPLMNNIIIHDAFDIMNGRRPTGAKLEIKIRVRDPLLIKKIDKITEKWLVLE